MSEHLKALEAQHAELAAQIAAAKAGHRAAAVAQVKAVMAEHGLSLADVAGKPVGVNSAGIKRGKAPVKYADTNGNTWSGRGQMPRWLTTTLAHTGGLLEDFKIAA